MHDSEWFVLSKVYDRTSRNSRRIKTDKFAFRCLLLLGVLLFDLYCLSHHYTELFNVA